MEILRNLNADQLPAFLSERPYAVVHLDAKWDNLRHVVLKQIRHLAAFSHDDTSFGYLDIDLDHNREHAKGIGLLNVPSCSYYRGQELIATVIGMNQDIAANLATIRAGGRPDTAGGGSPPK
jgi:hypothetical protein